MPALRHSRDPLGLESHFNLFGYAMQSPMTYTDPSGQLTFLPGLAALLIAILGPYISTAKLGLVIDLIAQAIRGGPINVERLGCAALTTCLIPYCVIPIGFGVATGKAVVFSLLCVCLVDLICRRCANQFAGGDLPFFCL